LRIHSKDLNFIFDYKTGSSDYNKARRYDPQLQFYELIYYLIESPDLMTSIRSHLYFIEQKDLKNLNKRIDLTENIKEIVQNLLEKGFRLNQKKDPYENVEITRRDLLAKGVKI